MGGVGKGGDGGKGKRSSKKNIQKGVVEVGRSHLIGQGQGKRGVWLRKRPLGPKGGDL